MTPEGTAQPNFDLPHGTPGGVGGQNMPGKSEKKASSTDGPRRPFVCYVCVETFREAMDLLTHGCAASPQPVFLCPLCGANYRNRNCLASHINLHRERAPYPRTWIPQ
ncbi:hypothetical protein HPB50_016559 [Hyalomma asiaticum]|uniref:Uncharacterized protein n=1 Tax=Hyalomma asiaticum TaxID=266040 RepID=A0ACB7T5B6_HYAAI|nr:hypothetical protein HPB50_016559 [Hyalomma asiaticum]